MIVCFRYQCLHMWEAEGTWAGDRYRWDSDNRVPELGAVESVNKPGACVNNATDKYAGVFVTWTRQYDPYGMVTRATDRNKHQMISWLVERQLYLIWKV